MTFDPWKRCQCVAQEPDDSRHCADHEPQCPLYYVPMLVHETGDLPQRPDHGDDGGGDCKDKET